MEDNEIDKLKKGIAKQILDGKLHYNGYPDEPWSTEESVGRIIEGIIKAGYKITKDVKKNPVEKKARNS